MTHKQSQNDEKCQKVMVDTENICSYTAFMNFKVAPDAYQKLSLLDDTMRFEPAGAQPQMEKEAVSQRVPKPLPCISEVATPTGKKPILKAMMTTACERNCYYCPFRAGRNQTKRITFTPDEMAATHVKLVKAKVV